MTVLGVVALDLEDTSGVQNIFDGSSGAGTLGIDNTGGRYGNHALTLVAAAFYAQVNLLAQQTTFNLGFGLKFGLFNATHARLLQFDNQNGIQITIAINSDGSIEAYRGDTSGTLLGISAPGVIVAGSYQHIEVGMTIDTTVGALQIWINEISVLNITAANTQASTGNYVTFFRLECPWSTDTFRFSDIVYGTARLFDNRVELLVPTGDGFYTQFTPSTGVTHWPNVDDIPSNGDTDYNETAVVGNIDTFTHAALVSVPASITAVVVNVRARNTTVGLGAVAPFMRSSATDQVGVPTALNINYEDFQSVFPNDPATSAPWANAAAVNAAQFGYKRTA